MYLIQPLIWMFSVQNFKKHFLSLFFILIFLIFLSVCFFLIYQNFNISYKYIFAFLSIFSLISVFLVYQGYFWDMTSNIIERKTDVITSSVFDKKQLKIVEIIQLPEFKILKFWWRGTASIVASLLLIYPLILLVLLSYKTSIDTFHMFNFTKSDIIATYIGLYIFIGLFVPAFLWNYAYKNSVVSVWNLPKAVYLMGNYTLRYFINVALFLLFTFTQNYINTLIFKYFKFNQISWNIDYFMSCPYKIVLFIAVMYLIHTYWLFVYAYLLGTITPPDEQ